ncbi:MAG: DNA-formamidopyrimidine glycosylase family protein [Acidimicrobiales bacterium]|nr:DNA-formamidopyrimidine glycosylase family protein [Acidimicrobiales bacterium]MDP6902207.1 DNA-formamidopyrimidine glycosylase family protein [Acidimicrobiales bacterium]HJL98651.1 DNA-formamidopyrimidine glycosylase family protein [Acidimicrobiales bacterium]
MPELIEVELYRKAATRALNRTVSSVLISSQKYLKQGTQPTDLRSAVCGSRLVTARRTGKLLLLEIGTAVVGLRFGMTGRLIVDGEATINELLYTTSEVQQQHIRFVMNFDEGGTLAVVDPRSFGNVELNPDETSLGPDAMHIPTDDLAQLFKRSRATIKAVLLDQAKISGIGNLLCDEILWRTGLSPTRAGCSLNSEEIERVTHTLRNTIRDLTKRGGSHTGDLQSERHRKGVCPTDGVQLEQTKVAGRTSWWCPEHQL